MSDTVRQGGCRCGKVRFEASGEPLISIACHCKNCQRMTSSAFSLSEGYPASQFRVTQGEPVIGGIHGPIRHYCCDFCKSCLFTEMPDVPDFVNVRTTLFDDASQERPFVETYVVEALPWARTGAAHSFDGLPPMERWSELMQEFAKRRAAVPEEANQ